MPIDRRTFLKQAGTAAGAALMLPAILPAQSAPPARETPQAPMNISRVGSKPSKIASPEYFSGQVRMDPLNEAPPPARVAVTSVTFEPAARTNWHTHPLGQTLYVTAGAGWIQREGGPIEEIRPGDVVWIPPAEKHWHGAAPTTAMTHLSIVEKLDGKNIDWLEKVTDEQYRK